MSSAEELVEQLRAGTPEAQEVADIISRMIAANVDSPILKAAENRIQQTWLNNGTPITTDTNGTQIDPVGLAYYDRINLINPGTIGANPSERRQLDITMAGGGADCMFDVIVSTCFSTLPGWAEGNSFKSVSGCTFYGYTTWQGALNQMISLGGARAMYVCKGSYTENVSAQNISVAYTIVCAGEDVVTLTGASSASPTFRIGTSTTFSISDVTMVGNGANVVFDHADGGIAEIRNMTIKPQSGGQGFVYSGGEFVRGLRIAGTSAAQGVVNATLPGVPAVFNDVWITGCGDGFEITQTTRFELRNAYISGATNGINFSSNSGAKRSVFTGIIFDSCTTGILCTGGASDDSVFSNNVFLDCTTGIDLSVANFVSGNTGVRGCAFTDNRFFLTTNSAQLGFKASGANAGVQNSMITGNTFRNYTSGNEINGTGAFGTGVQAFHNISDAGTMADYGSPVGHNASGTVASSSAEFVTLALDSSLSAERVLTAGSGITITDNGANSTVVINATGGGSGGGTAVGARVFRNTAQSITNNTTTAVQFDNETEDSGSMHDNVTNNTRITVPQAGKYVIVGYVQFASNSTGKRVIDIRVNGATFINSQGKAATTGEGISDQEVAAVYPLSANDYVEITCFQNSGGALNVSAASFSVYLIAATNQDRTYQAVVDGSTASTTVPYAIAGPFPHAGTVTAVYAKCDENKTIGATSWIGDVHKILAASQDSDGQGTTLYTTQGNRPTIANTHMATTATLPDVTSFAAGDWLAFYTDQVGTNATFVTMTVQVSYT